jgi:hypothetical protein
MSTQPRISAPIGRVEIRTSARKRSASSIGRVQAAELPCDVEDQEEVASGDDGARRRYYPFAPRAADDSED